MLLFARCRLKLETSDKQGLRNDILKMSKGRLFLLHISVLDLVNSLALYWD